MTGGDDLAESDSADRRTQPSDFDEVIDRVREQVSPNEEEREALAAAAERLADRARDAIDELPVDADVMQVGSTGRGTWVAGDRDIDLFVRFSPDLPREELEQYGLEVGNTVLPEGHEEYAEHPYVKGTFEGYDVDLVPCYRVESATDIKSAVDRTPFHNEYLKERLTPELESDVRVFKQFLKGIGAYGSDLRTEGFSGYLTELLAVEYGGFRETLEAVAEWHPPVHLDPENHATAEFDDPLVVIDPTDPERNVAAVVSETNVARVQHHARALLDEPREEVFFPEPTEPLATEEVREHVNQRGTTPVAIRFDAPDLVEDQLYPQLFRSRDGLVRGLEKEGFDVLRSATFANDDAVLFVELTVASLPAVEKHEGPPVHVEGHARGFYEKYEHSDAYGPFVEDGRYVVERDRRITTAREFIEEKLFDVALGTHVERMLANDGYNLLVGEEITSLVGEFGVELADYFEPSA